MTRNTCDNCTHYNEERGESYGTCQRNAPPAALWNPEDGDAPVLWAAWPRVTSMDSCGEFRSKELKYLGASAPPAV